MPSEKTVTKCSDARRSTKPIMEKRRRARINNSLSELKNLILDALKKDNARHSKLEKADILEMTVKHLQNLQLQQRTSDPSGMAKFRSGFAECANEVGRFFGRVEDVNPVIRQRLINHLANCLTGMNNPPSTPLQPVHVQVSGMDCDSQTRFPSGLQLVPTRLANGDLAFLIPTQVPVYAPSTVPISPVSSTSSPPPVSYSPSPVSYSPSPVSTSSSPVPSSPGLVSVLGSSGILSPAVSDRCTPSPISHTKFHSGHMYSNSPVVPLVGQVEAESVWRPW